MPISPLRRAAAAAAVAAVGATASLLPGSPASAQATCYPPTANCATTTTAVPSGAALTLGLSATTVTRGQTIVAVVGGAASGTAGSVSILSVERQLGTFTVVAGGTATTSITIPLNTTLGAHTILVRATASNGTAASVSRAITVVTGGVGGVGGGGRSLARTGAVVIPAAIVGLGLVAGGAALKRSSRRGTTTSKG